MKTILRMVDKREACTNCSTISPEDRLFLNPMLPVAQNVQPILHPTFLRKERLVNIKWLSDQNIKYLGICPKELVELHCLCCCFQKDKNSSQLI